MNWGRFYVALEKKDDDARMFNCFNKWNSNIGMGNTDEDGKVNFVDGTVKIFAYFPAGRNPYFGLTKRS